MRRNDEALLDNAVASMKNAELDASEVREASKRVASRLGLEVGAGLASDHAMQNAIPCDELRRSLAPYRARTLSAAHSLKVEEHLRDCEECRREFDGKTGTAKVDWSAPHPVRSFALPKQAVGWAFAMAAALLICTAFVYRAYWQVPPGVRAEVRSIHGTAYRLSVAGEYRLNSGDELKEGDQIRTAGGSHAEIQLSDGSVVELNERSNLAVAARGRNMTVALADGSVIVQAAKRTSGHLYVKTPDCRTAVTGTVFSVSSGLKGSRVAVLEGTVEVAHAGIDSTLRAGDQMTTSEKLTPVSFERQIAWSQNRDKYLPLLAAFSTLRDRIGQIPFPEPRYTSDLMARVPANTVLYVSIPNLGEFLSQANTIFHDQLTQSPALQEWWDRGHAQNSQQLDAMVEKVHEVSQYLGDEVVVVGAPQASNNSGGAPGVAVVADVKKSGLDDLLKTDFTATGSGPGLIVLTEQTLAATPDTPKERNHAFALLRPHEVVFSNSTSVLKQMDAQLNASSSGFAASPFGQQINAAYSRGAGIIVAADLHQIMSERNQLTVASQRGAAAAKVSGVDAVQYLIAEHREIGGVPENHLNVQFAGARQKVASWLAAPAPIGSLDYVTPNAAIAVAGLTKDPKEIADDIIAMAAPNSDAEEKLNKVQTALHINFRDDIAANLGGDFLLSLDGPVLPMPSWKAVIEVQDAQSLEQTLERLAQAISEQTQGSNGRKITIETSDFDAQKYYAIRDIGSGNIVAQYTFSEGYMIVAPTRALIIQALQAKSSGDSLSHSSSFKALLPKDDNENYSAIAYQNLSPVLSPLLSQLGGDSADAIRKLAADSRPTAICAWGRDSRIELASDSRLFGFDFLTLGHLLHSGNHPAQKAVVN